MPKKRLTPINKTIKAAKKEELVKLLLLLAKEHPAIKDKVRLFLSKKEEITGGDYAKIVKQYLQKQVDRKYGMLKWNKLGDIYKHFTSLLRTLSDAEKMDDVLNLSIEVIVQVNEHLNNSDDSYGHLSDTISAGFLSIEGQVQHNLLDKEAKKRLFDQLMKALDNKKIHDFDTGRNIWAILSQVITLKTQYVIFTKKMEEAVKEEAPDSWIYKRFKKSIIINSLQALYTLQMDEAAAQFILDHLQYEDIRKIRIEECLEKGDYTQAKTLTQDGLAIAKKEDRRREVFTWEEMFLTIALSEGDDITICRWAKHNLLAHPFTLNNFLLYKKHSPAVEWESRRNQVLKKYDEQLSGFSNNSLLEIFKEEKMYADLFNTIANDGNDFYVLDAYEDVLIAHDKEKTIKLYLHRIEEFLEVKVERKFYKVAVRYLKKIKEMGGEKEVKQLVTDLRGIYKRRTSLLQELAKL